MEPEFDVISPDENVLCQNRKKAIQKLIRMSDEVHQWKVDFSPVHGVQQTRKSLVRRLVRLSFYLWGHSTEEQQPTIAETVK